MVYWWSNDSLLDLRLTWWIIVDSTGLLLFWKWQEWLIVVVVMTFVWQQRLSTAKSACKLYWWLLSMIIYTLLVHVTISKGHCRGIQVFLREGRNLWRRAYQWLHTSGRAAVRPCYAHGFWAGPNLPFMSFIGVRVCHVGHFWFGFIPFMSCMVRIYLFGLSTTSSWKKMCLPSKWTIQSTRRGSLVSSVGLG